MDVPAGWVHVIRGPRPPSQKWPSVPRPRQQRQSQLPRSGGPVPQRQNPVPRTGGEVQSNRVQPTRLNPVASRELAVAKIAKLEKALGVMGECKRPAVEALKAELERTQASENPGLGEPGPRPRDLQSTSRSTNVGSSFRGQKNASKSWMRNVPPRQLYSKKQRIVFNGWRSSKHSSPIPMRTQPRAYLAIGKRRWRY